MVGMPWDDFAADPPQPPGEDVPPWADYAQQDQSPGIIDQAEQWIDKSALGTIGRDLARGGVNTGDSLMGIAGLLSGGRIPQALGYDSSGIRQHINAQDSPEQQAARQQMDQAQGVGGTLQVLRDNPSLVGHMAVESVPSMIGGGLAGRGIATGLKAAGVGAGTAGVVGAGAGEGLVGAGQQAEQTRQETGTLTPGQSGLALLSGGLTGLLGAAGARIGRKLGVADIDMQMAGANGADVAKGLVNRTLRGTGIESLEELSQSGQQQVLTNLATDRPALEGVDKQMVLGVAVGGAMGGAASLRRPVVPMPMPAQQQQGLPQTAPVPMPTPAPAASAPTAPPQGLHAQVMAAKQSQQAPAPTPAPTPFAGSQDLNPLLDNLGLQGERRTQTLDLLRPVEADMEARRRGVVTEAEQKRLANLIGLDGAQALAHGRKLGQTFNAEQFRAVTSAVQTQMTSVLEMQQRIASGQASDIERAQFVDDLANMRRTTGELLGARAEAGRALAAQRRQVVDIKQAQAILESVGGVSGADNLATAIGAAIQSGGLQNAAKVIQKGNHITDYIKAGWLSDPTTHIANMVGNTGMVGVNVMDRTNAAVLAGAKRMFGLKGETTWSEPVALLSGAIRGQMKAAAATGKAFTEGESPLLGSGKLEASSLPRRTLPGMKGTAKLAIDNTALLSFRFLGAEDAYFAVTNYEAELRALAHCTAFEEKKAGTLPQGVKKSQRIEQLVSSPTPAMIEQSGDFARESTFNKRAGPFASKLLAAKAAVPWLNIVIPFVRTPLNVLERAWKGSPLGLVTPGVWRDIRAGGATQEAAISKMMTGTQIMIGAGLLAQAGYLSGSGPDDEKERTAWLAAGNQPYSVKVGNTWHGINRLDPFAMWAGSVADLVQTDWKNKDAEQRALKLVSTFADNIVSKTWMSGVEGLSQALADPERYMGSYLQRTGASLLQPYAGLSGIAARQDPYARKPDSLLEAIKVRTPGLRESVPVRLDSWGGPIANNRQGDTLFNALAPMTHVEASDDPVRLEAARIGWAPGKAQDHFTVKKQRYDLSAENFAEFNELAGKLMHMSVQRAMKSKGWAALGDDEKRDFLDAELKKARTTVRLALIPLVATGNRRAIDNLLRVTGHPGVKK
nr:hypothetical protein [uncultured Pseudomonas sp.]